MAVLSSLCQLYYSQKTKTGIKTKTLFSANFENIRKKSMAVRSSLGQLVYNNFTLFQVCLGKFHSVWLCGVGEAWCCGQLARAGGPHATALSPTPLRLPEPCAAIAITLNSTIFLMENGTVCRHSIIFQIAPTKIHYLLLVKIYS